MAGVGEKTPEPGDGEPGVFAALWDAARAGLLAALLAFPILALSMVQNSQNQLVLEQRWLWIAYAGGAIFALRLFTRSPSPQGFVRSLLLCALIAFVGFAAFVAAGSGLQAGLESALARAGDVYEQARLLAETKLGIKDFYWWVTLFVALLFVLQLLGNPRSAFGFLRFVVFVAICAAAVYCVVLILQSKLPEVARYALAGIIGTIAFIMLLLYAPLPKDAEIRPQQVSLRNDLGVTLKPWLMMAMLGAIFAFPIVLLMQLGPQASLKWINNYGVQILIYVMLGWGLNIVVGLAGLLDLGYVAFYAVGAYAYALLSTTFGLSFWICLPLAGILAAFWGVLLGFPVLRLRGDYLAIVTLAFGEIIRVVLINWTDFSNGYAGISSIPRVTFFGIPFIDGPGGFAARFGLEFLPIHRTIFLFYLILFLALITNFVTLRLRRLPIGRAWEALREDETACRSLGINTVNTKLTAFALGAMFGGFAGAFFAVRQNFVSPDSFTFIESATILAIVVLGGMGSQIGVALAAIVMIGGTEILRELDFLKQIFGNDFDPALYRMLIFGLAMVVMMIWKPRGIISTRTPSIFLNGRPARVGAGISSAHVKEGHA